jgi:putative membrane protein
MPDSQTVDDASEPARDEGAASRTGMAAERTWLAWWRTALGATAGALAVGRFAPQALNAPSAPYIVLGCMYGLLAIGLLVVGARRQHGLQRAIERDEQEPLPFGIVAVFTFGGVVLALMTVVLVVARA